MIIPDTAPKISNDKKSLNSRHILPPSFLFRRKEAKENHLRSSHSLRSSRFRQPATQNGRFTYEPSVFPFQTGRAGKRLFLEKHPPPQCLLFLFFKKRKRTPLLFFLEEKKQKKIICGTAFFLRSCRFHQPVTQNGRFTYEPSVFRSGQDMRESVFPRKRASPAVSFVSFLQEKKTYPFKKRNRPPLEEKKSSPQRAPSYLPKMRFSSDGGSVAFGTKAGAAVPAAVGVGAASAGPP